MRAGLIASVAVAAIGFLDVASTVQAAPAAPVLLHELAVGAPAITLVRQRCGVGMKREKAWQDKQGGWHGRCVPKNS